MKVTGPGSGQPPAAPGEVQEAGRGTVADGARTTEPTTAKGAAFAEKVERGGAKAPAAAARAGSVAEIGAELQAGRITAEAALERVIHRVLDRQLGANAPAAVREQVGAALRQALSDDPVLAEKVRALAER
jgi:hypothetical protein